MTNPIIIEEVPITISSLKDELENIKKKKNELGFRSSKTLEYLSQFKHIERKKSDEIISKIQKLSIPRLKDQHIYKIIDVMPNSLEELKSLLQGFTLTVSNDNLKKIMETIKTDKNG